MARLKVRGSPAEIDVPTGTSILGALQAAGYPVSTSCGGRAICGLCRIMVLQGREILTPIDPKEITHLGNVAKVIGARLACQACVTGDGEIEVDVPAVVDHTERKRGQQLRRASHGRAGTGRSGRSNEPMEPRPATPPAERTEWRPRILEGGGQQGPKR